MLQIRDKKAYRKHIETMNPINAKSVQLVELHAFAYCLLYLLIGIISLPQSQHPERYRSCQRSGCCLPDQR